jgi:hypothetical protein
LILGSLRLWDVFRGAWGRLLRYAEGGEEKAAGCEQKALQHAPQPTSAFRSVRDDFHPVLLTPKVLAACDDFFRNAAFLSVAAMPRCAFRSLPIF